MFVFKQLLTIFKAFCSIKIPNETSRVWSAKNDVTKIFLRSTFFLRVPWSWGIFLPHTEIFHEWLLLILPWPAWCYTLCPTWTFLEWTYTNFEKVRAILAPHSMSLYFGFLMTQHLNAIWKFWLLLLLLTRSQSFKKMSSSQLMNGPNKVVCLPLARLYFFQKYLLLKVSELLGMASKGR